MVGPRLSSTFGGKKKKNSPRDAESLNKSLLANIKHSDRVPVRNFAKRHCHIITYSDSCTFTTAIFELGDTADRGFSSKHRTITADNNSRTDIDKQRTTWYRR